jgi:peroxiredoxin Q/BCP
MLTMTGVASGDVPYVPGDPVSDFTLNDAYGTPVSLSDFEGKVIVINFWADW